MISPQCSGQNPVAERSRFGCSTYRGPAFAWPASSLPHSRKNESDRVLIENNFFEEFGYDYLAPVTDWLFEEDSLEINNEFPEYLDEDELMSFLNEFYIVYPDKIPPAEYE